MAWVRPIGVARGASRMSIASHFDLYIIHFGKMMANLATENYNNSHLLYVDC